jgi:plastocyanin
MSKRQSYIRGMRSWALALVLFAATACEDETFGVRQNITAPPPLWTRGYIDIKDNFFNPVPLTVTQHTRVFFTNKGTEPHTVTFDAPVSFDSGWLSPNQETNRQMNALGTFTFRCARHPEMKGTITVVSRTLNPTL